MEADDDGYRLLLGGIAEGKDLGKLCRESNWSVGVMITWIWEDEARKARYLEALKVRAEVIAHQCLPIADGKSKSTRRDQLKIDTRLKLASKWDRARYGEQVRVESAHTVTVDAGLVGFASELLSRRREKVVEGEDETHLLPAG